MSMITIGIIVSSHCFLHRAWVNYINLMILFEGMIIYAFFLYSYLA